MLNPCSDNCAARVAGSWPNDSCISWKNCSIPLLLTPRLFFSVLTANRRLKYPGRAWFRDISNLLDIGTIRIDDDGIITLNLDWPQELSESEFLHRYENLPSAVSANHPAMAALSQLLNRRR